MHPAPNLVKLPQALLIGTPHSGKTTLFSRLSKTSSPVGKTVEEVHGRLHTESGEVCLIDLPGIYRLGENSPEEALSMHCLCQHEPRLVISVLDSSKLETQLYLSQQLWHFGWQVIIVLNMSDEAHNAGLRYDIARLEKLMGVRVIRTDAFHGHGIRRLARLIGRICYKEEESGTIRRPYYGDNLESMMHVLTHAYDESELPPHMEPTSYIVTRLLEGNKGITEDLGHHGAAAKRILELLEDSRQALRSEQGYNPAEYLADKRYGLIHGIVREVKVKDSKWVSPKLSTELDRLLTHHYLGLVIFGLIMFCTFYLAFTLGNPLVDLLGTGFDKLAALVSSQLPNNPLIESLITRGIIGGVGGVMSFIPTIIILFGCLSLLESTGYMARAAYLMDRFMHHIGLHGKSFIPMLLGFSCNVPAVLATRSIESRVDRLATMFIIPWMNCSARLVVFTLIIQALIPPAWQGLTLWALYLLGLGLALLVARILKSTLLKGEEELFVMELPPYRLPTWKNYLHSLWDNAGAYLKKASTFILFGSIILWGLNTFPLKLDESGRAEVAHANCYSARVGKVFEPISQYAGMDWKTNSAMIGAFSAKELLVTQLCILFEPPAARATAAENAIPDDQDARATAAIRSHYNIPQALSIMVFTLLGLPCIGTMSVILKESGSWTFITLQFLTLNLIAFGMSVLVYQVSKLILL